jgi:UDP:flavonoid glycosyltransferase YjiC (YdhE family)
MLGLPEPLSRLLELRSQQTSMPVEPGKSIGNIWLVLLMSGFARPNYLRRLVEAEIQAAVEFPPYVPANVLLPRCDWTICHGGQNTIIQSLLRSVPLIIFPGPIFERRYNARKVEQAKAGIMGEVNQFTVEWLRTALERQRECAPQAAVFGKRLRSYGGPSAAVEAIMNWNRRHCPTRGR